MKTGAVRAGSLLVGVASLLALPGIASGQIDVGKTVGEAVGEVGKAVPQVAPPAPVQAPAVPVQPAPARPAPRQAPSSAPAAPAPSPAGGGGGDTSSAPGGGSGSSGGSGSGGGASGSRAGGDAGGGADRGGGGKAKASRAGSKHGGKQVVLAAQDPGSLSAPDGENFTGAVTTSPDTGVQGDPELAFTGLQVLLLLAMGAVALATGLALRTVARRRHAG